MPRQQKTLMKIKFFNLSCLSVFIGLVFQLGAIEVSGIECGTVDILVPRILGGAPTLRGEWPFLAALYYVTEMQFICGGTLISMKHVLTAAHCIHWKDSGVQLLSEDVIVFLGAYNLSAKIERNVIQRKVIEIIVHPDWKQYSDKYDSDISILVVNESVAFTNYIRPVCIPADDTNYDDARGSIVGWGVADNGTKSNLDFPRHAITNILNASYCLTKDPYIAFLSSLRTFCGSGAAPMKGDSGGGLFVLSGSAWVQYGIISALRINATGIVDANSFAIYTNVKLFTSWISETVNKSGGTLMTVIVKRKINLACDYFETKNGYTCSLEGLDIQSENLEVASFTGYHYFQKTDLDVENLLFWNGTYVYLPEGIGNIFRNLKTFVVNDNLNFKFPSRSNFKNLENLVTLDFYNNSIETFDMDTLWDLPNLEIFRLYKNSVRFLPERMLEKNTKLRQVWITNNDIDTIHESFLWYLPNLEIISLHTNKLKVLHYRTFEKNTKLRHIFLNENDIETLDENTLWNLPNLEIFYIHKNKIKVLHKRTFEKNIKLRDVSLNHNDIETLDGNSLWNLTNLETFYIHNNKLKVLPKNFFQQNVKLRDVSLHHNDIETLNGNSLWNLTNLETFYIHNNKLKVLPKNFFQQNVKLREIWLFENYIETLYKNTLWNLPKLEILYIQNNKLKALQENTFKKNPILKKVLLNYNQLEFLPRDLFKDNLLLETVEFYGNSIKIIHTDFSGLKNIREISFYENVCINALYDKNNPNKYLNHYRNLTDFQNLIRVNCSSGEL